METLNQYLAILFLSPIIVLLLHALWIRALRACRIDLPPQACAILAMFTGFFPVALAAWRIHLKLLPWGPSLWTASIYGIIVYKALAYAYFHFFNISETSRRLKILLEVWSNKELDHEQLAKLYPTDEQIFIRLERLTDVGQLRREGDRYVLNSRLLCAAAQVLAAWGELIGFHLDRP